MAITPAPTQAADSLEAEEMVPSVGTGAGPAPPVVGTTLEVNVVPLRPPLETGILVLTPPPPSCEVGTGGGQTQPSCEVFGSGMGAGPGPPPCEVGTGSGAGPGPGPPPCEVGTGAGPGPGCCEVG